MMTTNANIQSQLETVKQVFEAALATLNRMKDGERMQIKELAETVASTVSMESKYVLGYVNNFAHNTDVAYVTRGKNGGVVKGVRPIKVVKVKRVKKVADPAVTSDSLTDAVTASDASDATVAA